MRTAFRALLAAGVAGTLMIGAGPVRAADAFTPEQKAALGQVIRDYLIQNPEVLDEAMAALEKKRSEQAEAQQNEIITNKAAQLLNSPHQVVLGNPAGKVTVVEFFDYNCGYCKRALPDMVSLLDQDKDLRFVLKEFPVLGPGSVEAAHVAAAVNVVAPDKYFEFHKKLLGGRGEANKARALEAAGAVGIDTAKVEAAMKAPEVQTALEESFTLANGLGLTGTPSYVVGQKVIPGAIGMPKLKERITEVRACLPKAC